ncbi:MAG TPA: transglutaminase domain-containing protein [Panacibacter sp.]|nr:transglutaminase domain-containing protein [Panacibacter sp.]
MKLLMNILLFFASAIAFPQGQYVKNSYIDVNTDQIYSPEKLAKLLIANDTTDRQRITSVFRWITENIAYNTKAFKYSSPYSPRDYRLEEDDDTSEVLKPLNERVSQLVLKRKTAVCDGYARLFKTLCDYADIKCEIITGYARANINRTGSRFISNHKWNVVFLDSSWQLLDVTWASGYINYRDEFEKEYNGSYFLARPEEFILDHYPEELRWTMLPDAPIPKEFELTPFKSAAFSRNYITAFKPVNGIIEASVGDSIIIELETNRTNKKLWITDSPNADSSSLAMLQCCGFINPVNTIRGNKVSIVYKVTSKTNEWLNVICDDEFMMRYKVNLRKQ